MRVLSTSDRWFRTSLIIVSIAVLLKLFSMATVWDPETSMTVPQIIRHWRYPVEVHEVITEDGYILTIHRIAHGVNPSVTRCTRPPIIIDHSFLCDSSEFVMNPPQSSPAMILADAGFDVFLMNHRGTTYCKKHRDFNESDPRFWEYTIDEHGKYDNPAVIDYVLDLTGESSLYWMGHSQGAALGLTMLAERPEYNPKIRALFQLTPPGTAHYSKGFWRLAHAFYTTLKPLHDFCRMTLGSHELGIEKRAIPQIIMQIFCATPVLNTICKYGMHFGLGKPSESFNYSRLPVYISHLPASTSTWNMLHWGQIAARKKLERFDHNPDENMARYGQIHPPAYNLSMVDVPVYIFWSSSDWLVPGQDIEEDLIPMLKHDVVKGVFEVSDYNHLDFVTATDNAEKVFSRVINIVKKRENDMCEQ